MFKFSANLGFLFAEYGDYDRRIMPAKAAGFQGVELSSPYHIPAETIAMHLNEASVPAVLLNSDSGPGAATALINRIHILSGKCPSQQEHEIHNETFIKNLRIATELLSKEGVCALIEPLNSKTFMPNYFMDNTSLALEIIRRVNHPNLKLQLDFYHVQGMEGDLTATVNRCLPHIGHVQVAQVPGRRAPHTEGEINYRYIFNLLKSVGYNGWIGGEYVPNGPTEDSLDWLTLR